MPKWGIVVSSEMDKAMRKVTKQQGATVSNVVRLLVEQYLKEHGVELQEDVQWGGNRKGLDRTKE